MDLLVLPVTPAAAERRRTERAALLIGATVRARVREGISRAVLERIVRARVEREYARQGITPVEYDLQVL